MTRSPRRLHLGAFDQVQEAWLNTDVTPHLFVARLPGMAWLLHRAGVMGADRYAIHRSGAFRSLRYLDVGRRFRFDDDTFEAVYASHLLEHLEPDVAERCLNEVRRVLRPGGVLRLAVPDLDEVVAQYDPGDPDRFLAGLYDAHSARRTRTSLHRWMYNDKSLEMLLQRVGFQDVQRCEFRQGRCPDVEEIETRRWSLFMEAVK